MTSLRIALAEDDVLLRAGLVSLLEKAGHDIVAEVGDADALVEAVDRDPPDIVVTDVRMPPDLGTDGLIAARTIRARRPDVAILVLSAGVEAEDAIDLLSQGRGVGYLLKRRVSAVDAFLDAVVDVAAGGSVIDPEVVRELLKVGRRDDPLGRLTGREQEVLALMAEGRSNAGIAKSLWVTEGTVEKHVQNILGKLDLSETPDDHRRVLAVIRYLERR
jgi:serine/threonine-protein kinase PknK